VAINSTIFKANLQIADMERHYYHEHALTIAQHPSETDERMMISLMAFGLHAHEYLEFGQGMTNEDEADLWQKDLRSVIEMWIDVGIPDEKLIRKACGRANQVVVYCYGGRVVDTWFTQNRAGFERLKNLTVINLPIETTSAIAKMAQRKMQLNVTIQDDQVWLGNGDEIVMIELVTLIAPPMRR
jgi:uncharacterized protein YaeQ